MNAHTSLLGIYRPGDGWLFRLPVGWKYAVMLALALPPFFIGQWWATAAALVLVVLALRTSGIGFRRIFSVGWYLWVVLGLLAFYQAFATQFVQAFIAPGNVLVAVLASRLLTLTTSTPDLMDALARGLSPLRRLRINPDAITLLVALMMRSIPFLAGSLQDVREAARARGRDRNPALLVVPAVVSAVAYAQRTGEALHARGLPDDLEADEPAAG